MDEAILDRADRLNTIGYELFQVSKYNVALTMLLESLSMAQRVENKELECAVRWNIGHVLREQGDTGLAEQYFAHTVRIEEEIGHPDLDEDREHLEAFRTKCAREKSLEILYAVGRSI